VMAGTEARARDAHLQPNRREPRLCKGRSQAHMQGGNILVKGQALWLLLHLNAEKQLEQLYGAAEQGPFSSATDGRLQHTGRLARGGH
jgi:hypothetical protein